MDCEADDEDDFYYDGPCFATQACVCDNGFFKISQKMPQLSNEEKEEIVGDAEVLTEALSIVEEQISEALAENT